MNQYHLMNRSGVPHHSYRRRREPVRPVEPKKPARTLRPIDKARLGFGDARRLYGSICWRKLFAAFYLLRKRILAFIQALRERPFILDPRRLLPARCMAVARIDTSPLAKAARRKAAL